MGFLLFFAICDSFFLQLDIKLFPFMFFRMIKIKFFIKYIYIIFILKIASKVVWNLEFVKTNLINIL